MIVADGFVSDPTSAAAHGSTVPGASHQSVVARFAIEPLGAGGWRAALLQAFGLPHLARHTPAQLVAGSLAADALWLATPVHLLAGLDRVHLPFDGILSLPPSACAALCDAFNPVFREDGVELSCAGEDCFVLAGLACEAGGGFEPQRWLGRDLRDAQPAGASRRFRALGAQIETWLHQQPLNRQRAAAGLPAVSQLWLWGAAPVGGAASEQGVPRARWLCGSDAYARAAARDAGVDLLTPATGCSELLQQRQDCGVIVTTLGSDAQRFESDWLRPALAAVREGRVDQLCILANDRQISLRRTDAWRPWRRR